MTRRSVWGDVVRDWHDVEGEVLTVALGEEEEEGDMDEDAEPGSALPDVEREDDGEWLADTAQLCIERSCWVRNKSQQKRGVTSNNKTENDQATRTGSRG